MKHLTIMKKYIAASQLVFSERILNAGDTVELDENHITTQALLDRKNIVETTNVGADLASAETPASPKKKPINN